MPDPAIVDRDAGETFGQETVALQRPFKVKGTIYSTVSFRVPTGLDLKKHTGAQGRINALALMCDLAELSEDVFDEMYAGDRSRVDAAVGRHLSAGPAAG